MNRDTLSRFAVGTAALAFAAMASIAPASAGVITADEFALGTEITNQYDGVLFTGVSGPVTILNDAAFPSQPVLAATTDGVPYAGDFWMAFEGYTKLVEFDSGFWDEAGTAIIDVYNTAGDLIDSLTNTVVGGIESFSLHYANEGIGWIYFNSIGDPAGGGIDNLRIVPEPGTLALLAFGLVIVGFAGFGSSRRRRWAV